MIMHNPATGELVVNLSHEEFFAVYATWQQKPETKAMFDRLVAERKACVSKILADMNARKGK